MYIYVLESACALRAHLILLLAAPHMHHSAYMFTCLHNVCILHIPANKPHSLIHACLSALRITRWRFVKRILQAKENKYEVPKDPGNPFNASEKQK